MDEVVGYCGMIDENVVEKSIYFCLQMRQVIVFLLAYRCFSFRLLWFYSKGVVFVFMCYGAESKYLRSEVGG